MRIGIDLGGSHIETGIIDGDNIIDVTDKIFVKEDRKNIRDVIINTAIKMIDELLKKNNLSKSEIELIGIASPRDYFKKSYS